MKRFSLTKIYNDGQFKKEIKDVITKRYATIDKGYPKPISFARVMEQIVKEPEWFSLKSKLLRIPRKERWGNE